VDLVTFTRGERKDDVLQRYLAAFAKDEGVLFIGKAQDKASVFRVHPRPGSGPAVSQVLHVFSVPGQALSQRARMAEAAGFIQIV
jgi:hypothetical protein